MLINNFMASETETVGGAFTGPLDQSWRNPFTTRLWLMWWAFSESWHNKVCICHSEHDFTICLHRFNEWKWPHKPKTVEESGRSTCRRNDKLMYINVQTLQFVSQHVENYLSFLQKRVLLCGLKFIGCSKPARGLKNVTASLYHNTAMCWTVKCKKPFLFIHLFLQRYSLSDSGNKRDIFVLRGEKSCMISAAATPFAPWMRVQRHQHENLSASPHLIPPMKSWIMNSHRNYPTVAISEKKSLLFK